MDMKTGPFPPCISPKKEIQMMKLTLYDSSVSDPIRLKSLIKILNTIASSRSRRRYRHGVRVGIYAAIIADAVGMTKQSSSYVRMAGLVHDVGLSAVNDAILDKPSRLTADEYRIVKAHPEIGAKMLDFVNLPDEIVKAVAQHHETFDGAGYPLGLKGEQISLPGRIVHLAEAFDMMTNDTPYRRASTVDAAIDMIQGLAGRNFDPLLVDALLNSEDITSFYMRKDMVPLDMTLLAFDFRTMWTLK